MLWLRDAESCGTYRSAVNENLESIDMMFDFDREIFSSKVYRLATRSSMIQALLDGQNEEEKCAKSSSVNAKSSGGFSVFNRDESDAQTIRERPVDICLPINQLQIQTAGGSRDTEGGGSAKSQEVTQLERVYYSISPDRLSTYMRTQTELHRSGKVRKQAHRKLIPGYFGQQLYTTVTSRLHLLHSKTDNTHDVGLFVLGASESGKSTLIRSIVAHQEGYTDKYRHMYRSIIVQNILDNMQSILDARRRSYPEVNDFGLDAEEFALRKRAFYNDPHRAHISLPLASLIKTLWNKSSVRNLVEPPSQCYATDCAEYFFKHIDRIAVPKYLPIDEDTIRARNKTKICETIGICETKLTIDKTQYAFWETSGIRSEFNKHIFCFEALRKLIFTADIAAYDETLSEDNGQNRMRETLNLFDFICNSRTFVITEFILFLHKVDKLERKLTKSPLKTHFPEYDGDPTDPDQVKDFFRRQFLGCFRYRTPNVTVHFTSLSDVKGFAALAVELVTK